MTINPFTPTGAVTTPAANTSKAATDPQPTTYDRPTTGFWELFGNPALSANLPATVPAPTPDPQYPDRPLLGFQALFWNPAFAPAAAAVTPAVPEVKPVTTTALPTIQARLALAHAAPEVITKNIGNAIHHPIRHKTFHRS